MYRAIPIVGAIVALGLTSWAAPSPKQPPSMVQKLNQRANLDGVNDPKTTLNDVLDKLSKLYDVSFDISETAFKLEGLMAVGAIEVANPPIPAMKNAKLGRVLRKILSRVPAASGATFFVRSDYIEITTGAYHSQAIWGVYAGPHLPTVNVELEKCSLENAIHQLSEVTDFNVILDNRAAEKAKTSVSVRFRNTPLDTAVRLLADMSDLRSVHLDNVLYVTTKENAAALEARLEKEKTPTNPLDVDDSNQGEFKPRKGTGVSDIVPIKPKAGA